MDIRIKNRWRKAVTVSVLVHVFLLILSNFMANRLLAVPPNTEQIIELELETAAMPSAAYQEDLAYSLPSAAASWADLPSQLPAPFSGQGQTIVAAEHAVLQPGRTGGSEAEIQAGSMVSGGNDGSAGTAGSSNPDKAAENGGNSAPRILSRVEPSYPDGARQAGIEGTVVLRVQILKNGQPGSIDIYRSSGDSRLDEAAVAALGEWRFIPARNQGSGNAIECYTTIPITFRLTK